MACNLMVNPLMRRAVGWWLPVLLVFFAACEEEGVVQVHSLKFTGVEHIDESALKSVLATHVNSKIPWGRKAYFDRTRFEADLKRIAAFYADRGYDAARVTGYDVHPNSKGDAVDITVSVAEGSPVLVAGVHFVGFEVLPPRAWQGFKRRARSCRASRAIVSWCSRCTNGRPTSSATAAIRMRRSP